MGRNTRRWRARRGIDPGAQSGYSLLELMSVIGIATILMTLGVPSYRYVTNSNRVSGEVNSLLGDLELARSAAIVQGQPVTVCPSSDGKTCSVSALAWQWGWIVFSDVNGNATKDAEDTILSVQSAFASASDTFLSDPGVYAVTFNREGFAANLPNTPTGHVTITLHAQPQNAQWTRCIQLSTIGMVTTERAQQGGECT
jgi:type IV fimbrial biogenesis protein FimT